MNARSLPEVNVNRERGVSLLEALITIVILAFGILGLAGLQSKLQTVEVESYARSQALVLLDDMAARLSANRGAAAMYATANPTASPVSASWAVVKLTLMVPPEIKLPTAPVPESVGRVPPIAAYDT